MQELPSASTALVKTGTHLPPAPACNPSSGMPVDGNDPGQGGLLEYWRMIRRRKGTLILIASLGTLAGVLISVPQTPIYQARASIEVQDLNADFLNIRQTTPVNETSGATTSLTDIQTQMKAEPDAKKMLGEIKPIAMKMNEEILAAAPAKMKPIVKMQIDAQMKQAF